MYYLLGGAGYHNFGDELMVKCWLEYLTRNGVAEEKIVVDGASKEKLVDAFHQSYPEVKYSDLVNKISTLGQSKNFWECAVRGATFFNRGGFDNYPHFSNESKLMMNASIIHIHGGGYLNKHFPQKGFLLGLAVAVARKTGAKLVGTGLGLVPLDAPKASLISEVESWIRMFSIIETRDEASAQYLRRICPYANVISGLDDTFAGDISYIADGRHRLHISWNTRMTNKVEFTRVVEYMRRKFDFYDEVVFWNCAKNDQGTIDSLRQTFPKIASVEFMDLIKKPIPVNQGDHMLTARFHPHLIAARAGAIGGYFSPGAYYDTKHGSVNDIGSGFFRIGNDEIGPDSFNGLNNYLCDRVIELRSLKTDIYADVLQFIS